MKKILILIMSCNLDLFMQLENNIRNTWAKDILDGKFEHIDYYSYVGSYDKKFHINKSKHILYIPCNDSLYGTSIKTIQCFKFILKLNIEYDYIVRLNTSTYLNVNLLNLLILSLYNKDIIYTTSLLSKNYCSGPYNYNLIINGKCMILSKKYINIIIDKKNIKNAFNNSFIEIDYNEFERFNLNGNFIYNEIFYKEKILIDDYFISLIINNYLLNNKLSCIDYFKVIGENDYFYLNKDELLNYITIVYKDREIEGFYGKNLIENRNNEYNYIYLIYNYINKNKSYNLDIIYDIIFYSDVFVLNDLLSYHIIDENIIKELDKNNDPYIIQIKLNYCLHLANFKQWLKNNTKIPNI